MPLPNTHVIHPGFQAHHAPVAERTMTAECVITRPATTPGAPTFDEVQGRSVYPDPASVYIGACRVQRSAAISTRNQQVGDRLITIREYIVSLPVLAPAIQVNDLVAFTACPDDATLVGQTMVVRDPRVGSTVWQHDLLCELYPATTR